MIGYLQIVAALLGGTIVMMTAPGVNAAGDSRTGEFFRVDPRNVEVAGEIGRRIDVTVDNNALVIDLDNDFLKPFQERNRDGGFVGLGMFIDALVRFAAYTDSPDVIARKKHAVETLLATQEDNGYIGFCKPGSRLNKLWDIHEMAYIIHGLVMDYRFFDNDAALDGARKAADYIVDGWRTDPDMVPGAGHITTYMAVTGLEPALIELYHATGDHKYIDFCTDFRKLGDWDGPIVLGRWGRIQGHAYAYMARCLAQLRLYRIHPDPALLETSHKLIDFLLNQGGLTITGACGQHECWHDTQQGLANLGETCATAYLIRFLDELMRLEGKPVYGDMIERAVYNALFGAQSPDGRRIRYYIPFEGPRVYFGRDTYCCPNNYRRIVAELPQLVYYRTKDGVAVNLYTPSEATLDAGGTRVTLRQATDYPYAGAQADTVVLWVEPERPAEFELALRIPGWCEAPVVRVNDNERADVMPGTFHRIEREWNRGDKVEMRLPMELRLVEGFNAQDGRVAVMRGPLMFCLNRELNPDIADENLRLITIKPDTLSGPEADDTVHPDGLKCTVSAWRMTDWYPAGSTRWDLVLTEFPDPDGEAAYFHLPNPNNPVLVKDHLLGHQD